MSFLGLEHLRSRSDLLGYICQIAKADQKQISQQVDPIHSPLARTRVVTSLMCLCVVCVS